MSKFRFRNPEAFPSRASNARISLASWRCVSVGIGCWEDASRARPVPWPLVPSPGPPLEVRPGVMGPKLGGGCRMVLGRVLSKSAFQPSYIGRPMAPWVGGSAPASFYPLLSPGSQFFGKGGQWLCLGDRPIRMGRAISHDARGLSPFPSVCHLASDVQSASGAFCPEARGGKGRAAKLFRSTGMVTWRQDGNGGALPGFRSAAGCSLRGKDLGMAFRAAWPGAVSVCRCPMPEPGA